MMHCRNCELSEFLFEFLILAPDQFKDDLQFLFDLTFWTLDIHLYYFNY